MPGVQPTGAIVKLTFLGSGGTSDARPLGRRPALMTAMVHAGGSEAKS